MEELKQMEELRSEKVKELENMVQGLEAEVRTFSEEEKEKFEAIKKEVSELDQKIEEARSQSVGVPQTIQDAITYKKEENNMEARTFKELVEERTLTTDGGANVPTDMVNDAIVARGELNFIRKLARSYQFKGNGKIPVFTGAGDTTATAEGGAVSENDNTLDMVEFGSYSYPNTYFVSKEQYEDDAFNVFKAFNEAAGVSISSREIPLMLNGNGTTEPQGLFVGGTAQGSVSALTYADLVDLDEALPGQYADGAVYIMDKASAGAIRKLEDSNGNLLFPNGIKTLFDKPVYVSAHAPAGKIALANIYWGYGVGDRGAGIDATVWPDYAKRRTGLTYETRFDAKVLLPQAIQVLTITG